MPTTRARVPWPALARAIAVVPMLLLISPRDSMAQMYGLGASPGRGSYRPAGLWNGPFYSAPHVDPWGARPAVSNGSIVTYADAPPYTSAPRGLYGSYNSERGATYSYQQGFSPYSGYADWYKKAYHVNPDAANIVGATNQFFRSSPIPANPAYLAPSVNQAFEEVARANALAASRTRQAAAPRVSTPAPPVNTHPQHLPGQAVIYRGVGTR